MEATSNFALKKCAFLTEHPSLLSGLECKYFNFIVNKMQPIKFDPAQLHQ
jgi:hypothetical protein